MCCFQTWVSSAFIWHLQQLLKAFYCYHYNYHYYYIITVTQIARLVRIKHITCQQHRLYKFTSDSDNDCTVMWSNVNCSNKYIYWLMFIFFFCLFFFQSLNIMHYCSMIIWTICYAYFRMAKQMWLPMTLGTEWHRVLLPSQILTR